MLADFSWLIASESSGAALSHVFGFGSLITGIVMLIIGIVALRRSQMGLGAIVGLAGAALIGLGGFTLLEGLK